MRRAVIGCVVVGALVVAGEASAKIVIQRGMAGVELGMTKSTVLATLGNPVHIKNSTNDFGSFTRFDYVNLTVLFQGGRRVSALRTTSRAERTAAGIGVGSTVAAVKAKVPRVKCAKEFGFRHCYVGAFKPGRVITDFLLRNGRVWQVVVGRVLD
jgi:hypothetical protein